ncbi:Uncharacterised protein [Mycobacteroides abscessus]|nr:Uncharacterised protein [Mycobacteroides abscessus]
MSSVVVSVSDGGVGASSSSAAKAVVEPIVMVPRRRPVASSPLTSPFVRGRVRVEDFTSVHLLLDP